MKLPFKRKIILHTHLTPQQSLDALSSNIFPAKPIPFVFGSEKYNTKFTGHITGNSFKVRPVIQYRNSFIPIITGQLTPLPNGTQIVITFTLIRLVFVFMCIWFAIMTIVGTTIAISSIAKGTLPREAFVPFGIDIFGLALFITLFNSEVNSAKEDLIAILKSSAA